MAVDMKQFSVALLKSLGAPVNHQNVASLVGWEHAEGGASHNNPFNTTQGAPGATTFNSVGVKSYRDFDEALHATVQTLKSGASQFGYGKIINALKQSNPSAFVNAVGGSQWGTSGSLLSETVKNALGQSFGIKPSSGNVKQGQRRAGGRAGAGSRTVTKTGSSTTHIPGFSNTVQQGGGINYKAAVANALLNIPKINTSGAPSSSNLLSNIMTNINSGAFTTPVTTTTTKTPGSNVTQSASSSGTVSRGGKKGPGLPVRGKNGKVTYVNPLQGVTNWERTDQGVDATMRVGAPIKAPGDVKILGIEPGWYAGQPFVYFQFLNGPLKGKVQYVAEQIDRIAKVGSVVREGHPIAHFAPSGTAIEYGWATPGGQTLAMATTGYTEGYATQAGKNLRRWLNQHGANAGTGAGLSIGAGPDADDLAAALKQANNALKHAITQTGIKYHKPKFNPDREPG